ncbi:MAG: hypothetical protein FJ387_30300 [Verrucomicrobia bacterium]|nr:hypothetical protein [Verrucomicrobiota bacterium]
MDCDGDGIAEFWHGSYRQAHTYVFYMPGWSHYYVDYTEAFFPAEHVQLYAHPEAQQGYRWNYLPTMLLEPGHRIVVNPQPECPTCPTWAWDPPEASKVRKAFGLGRTARNINRLPCYDVVCSDGYSAGYLDYTRGATNGLFGFRSWSSHGWHLGWLRVAYLGLAQPRPAGGYTVVRLSGYALHPDPDTEIAAGEEPRPRLRVELLAKQARLFWNTAFGGYTLEQTPRLDSPAWIPVPGVQANSVTLDLAEAKGFFRLRR